MLEIIRGGSAFVLLQMRHKKKILHLNFLKGVGDHSNEHVEKDDDDDEREDAVENPPDKLCQQKLWHVHVVLVGHTEHGPE